MVWVCLWQLLLLNGSMTIIIASVTIYCPKTCHPSSSKRLSTHTLNAIYEIPSIEMWREVINNWHMKKKKRMSLSVMAKRMSSLYRRLPRYCKLLGWACYTQVTSTGKPSVSLDTIQHYIVYKVSTTNLVDVVTSEVLYLARITWCRFCTIVTYGHSLVASFRSLKHLNFDWFSRGS